MNFQNILSQLAAAVSIIFGIFHPVQMLPVQSTSTNLDPLTIQAMREKSYPGSDVMIEQTLSPAANYKRYIASYESDGLKIYALLLIPNSVKPKNGFPVIILNHGYIIPEKYTPDGNYVAYADAFAKNGYIVFKPNYRGNGKSDGSPTSTYFSPDYTVDDLNAIESIKKLGDSKTSSKLVDATKIGVWGHSMGGQITLKDIVINRADIKAAVIWGGVVGSYNDIIYNWQNKVAYLPDAEDLMLRYKNLNTLEGTYGTPITNPTFWNSVDPSYFIKDIETPVQIDVGLADNQVPSSFSKSLYQKLKSAGKTVEYYEYPGANHDINQSFTAAMKNTITFFDRYLK